MHMIRLFQLLYAYTRVILGSYSAKGHNTLILYYVNETLGAVLRMGRYDDMIEKSKDMPCFRGWAVESIAYSE